MKNLQVQPLKVLATHEVVTKRLDYSTYLNGTTKDELDGLGRLAGNYKIHASKITIGAENMLDGENILVFSSPSSGQVPDWERFKEAYEGTLRTDVIEFIDGKEEFSIVESKTGPREWVISDVDGVDKVWLTGKGDLKQQPYFWDRHDHFIEDGAIVILYEMYNEKMEKIFFVRDSITTDKQGNVFRKIMWTLAWEVDLLMVGVKMVYVKIKKVMWAHRVPSHSCTIL